MMRPCAQAGRCVAATAAGLKPVVCGAGRWARPVAWEETTASMAAAGRGAARQLGPTAPLPSPRGARRGSTAVARICGGGARRGAEGTVLETVARRTTTSSG